MKTFLSTLRVGGVLANIITGLYGGGKINLYTTAPFVNGAGDLEGGVVLAGDGYATASPVAWSPVAASGPSVAAETAAFINFLLGGTIAKTVVGMSLEENAFNPTMFVVFDRPLVVKANNIPAQITVKPRLLFLNPDPNKWIDQSAVGIVQA